MITYEQTQSGMIKVRVDGKLSGRIVKLIRGYRYESNASTRKGEAKHVGMTFATIEDVKRSLEGDEE